MSTTIGEILDNFFAPWSKEKLWIMPESDNYTAIVRKWMPVVRAVTTAKQDLQNNCATWQSNHTTTTTWKPKMTPTVQPDPRAYDRLIASPPGTDPATCKTAFEIYIASKAASYASKIPLPMPIPIPIPEIQTKNLYTCAIGSFRLFITIDQINCATPPKKAKMNIWMYNAMSKHSFGRFASDPAFSQSGMKTQFMWWNWSEIHTW